MKYYKYGLNTFWRHEHLIGRYGYANNNQNGYMLVIILVSMLF